MAYHYVEITLAAEANDLSVKTSCYSISETSSVKTFSALYYFSLGKNNNRSSQVKKTKKTPQTNISDIPSLLKTNYLTFFFTYL